MSSGIDYGMGQTNIDRENGIRYGVISMHEVTQAWCDSSEGYYGDPHCPKCGNEAVAGDSEIDLEEMQDGETEEDLQEKDREELGFTHLRERGSCGDYACDSCRILFDSEDAFGDEPISHVLDDGEYKAEQGSDGDIFIMKSPYYTRARFCSPCAPGACYLTNPDEDGERAYCFGPDWFDDETPPYPVFSVASGGLVHPGPKEETEEEDEIIDDPEINFVVDGERDRDTYAKLQNEIDFSEAMRKQMDEDERLIEEMKGDRETG